jgi:hypothetical protein
MSGRKHADGRTDGTRPNGARVDNSSHNGRPATAPSPHRADSATAFAGNPLLSLVTRDDGWLRIIPSRDSESVYIKWKFSHGTHAGYYVMCVVQYWQMGYGLNLLVDKLEAVEKGTFKPTRDTPYSE